MDPRAGARAVCSGMFLLVLGLASIIYLRLDAAVTDLQSCRPLTPDSLVLFAMKLVNRVFAAFWAASSRVLTFPDDQYAAG